jgi:integrase
MAANIAKTSLPTVRDASPRPTGFVITDRFLKAARAKLGDRGEAVQFEAKSGLGVRVSPTNISFICQLPRKGRKPYRATIGTYGVVTIEQARDAVKALAGKIVLGVDPEEERRQEAAKAKAEAEKEEAQRFTVKALVDRWRKEHLSRQRPNYAASAYRRVIQHFDALLGVPATLIDRKEVRRAVERTRDKKGEAAARNTLVSLKAAYRWALSQDLIDVDPLNGLKPPPRTADRERALTLDEARAIWAASGRLDYPSQHFVRLLLLTGCRRNEILGLRWEEVGEDADGPVIKIPPGRTKTGSGHRVALSKVALKILDECRRNRIAGSPYVLTNDGVVALHNVTRVKAALEEALDADITDWTWHDFRRSIVSILAAKGHNPIVLDRLLGHQPTTLSAIARIYQKHEHADEQRAALTDWGDLLTAPPAEVVDLKKRRKRG